MRWTLPVVLVAVIGGAYTIESYRPASTLAGRIATTLTAADGSLASDSARPAPEWRNTSWLNADGPVSLESLKGRVVLLNFWVFTCYNCTNTLPSLRTLEAQYRPHGLSIIGIHTPEFPPYATTHSRA